MNSLILSLTVVAQILLFQKIEAALPPKDPSSRQVDTTPITLDDVLTGRFSARGFGGSWVPGSDKEIRIVSGGTVIEYDVESKENNTLVEETVFTEYLGEGKFAGLSISADRKYILVEHARNSLWRHSFLAKYDIYDLTAKKFTKLVPWVNGVPIDPQPELQLVRWSPTGNALAFVFQNNIYFRNVANESHTVVQITKDGSNAIFNGIADWVYEEEMFGTNNAIWFSKDSSSIAFVRFDDTEVQNFTWPVYGEPGVRETVYPLYEPIRYPKSGTANPITSVHVVELNGNFDVKNITYPVGEDVNLQYYIATGVWATNSQLILVNLNRAQNQSTWHLCSSTDGKCVVIYEFQQANGWIDAHTPTVSKDGSRFLTLQSVYQTEFNKSYTQIVEISTNGQRQLVPITTGMISVGSILGWDETNDRIYFSGSGWYPETSTSNPNEAQVYSIDYPTNVKASCITCSQKNNAGENCKSNSVAFSSNFTYLTHSCKGPGVPEVKTKNTRTMGDVQIWVDNEELRAKLALKKMPTTRDMDVTLPNGIVAKVRLYLPSDFDSKKKYPLLIDVYGGPDSQKINEDYRLDWGTSMVSDKQVIYGSIDGRGSAKQSSELKFSVYRNLGSAEIEDQIATTKYLIQNNDFIDANRTAIWGWSYGGYATSMVLGKDTENVFKCGISVAPVTSWLYYDTIYTERYMGQPTDQDNWVNYDASSVMNHLENFKTKQFLLIHGNSDDNVHYQQSMMLARALEKADILFYQLSYPEENHSIGGPGMRRHLYHSIERFLFRDCFGGFAESTNGRSGAAFSATFTMSFGFAFTIYSLLSYFQRF